MTIGVYKILNTANGKFYIGSSITIELRFNEHRYELNRGIHHNNKLQNAWNKYGKDAFQFLIVEMTDEESVRIAEKRWIDETDCVNSGYNIAPSSEISDYSRSPEMLRRLSEAHKNPSPELRERMRQNRLGRSMTPEARRNLSASMKRKYENGEILGEEHRQAIKDAYANMSPEKKAQLSEQKRQRMLGFKFSEQSKSKMSDSAKNRNISEEAIQARNAKLSQKSKESWAKKKAILDIVAEHKDKLVVLLSEGKKYTNAQLGEKLGISHWRISQLKKELREEGRL